MVPWCHRASTRSFGGSHRAQRAEAISPAQAVWQDRAGADGPAGVQRPHTETETDRMCSEKRMHVLSPASFSFSFLPSFLFSFLPFLFFLFSCSSGWPQTFTFQPLSARITGFPTILKFSGIVFFTTLVTLTGVSMLGYRAHVMIQGQFSRVGSLLPACGRTQGSNSECPAWGQVTESSHPPRRDISVIVFHIHNPGRFFTNNRIYLQPHIELYIVPQLGSRRLKKRRQKQIPREDFSSLRSLIPINALAFIRA